MINTSKEDLERFVEGDYLADFLRHAASPWDLQGWDTKMIARKSTQPDPDAPGFVYLEHLPAFYGGVVLPEFVDQQGTPIFRRLTQLSYAVKGWNSVDSDRFASLILPNGIAEQDTPFTFEFVVPETLQHTGNSSVYIREPYNRGKKIDTSEVIGKEHVFANHNQNLSVPAFNCTPQHLYVKHHKAPGEEHYYRMFLRAYPVILLACKEGYIFIPLDSYEEIDFQRHYTPFTTDDHTEAIRDLYDRTDLSEEEVDTLDDLVTDVIQYYAQNMSDPYIDLDTDLEGKALTYQCGSYQDLHDNLRTAVYAITPKSVWRKSGNNIDINILSGTEEEQARFEDEGWSYNNDAFISFLEGDSDCRATFNEVIDKLLDLNQPVGWEWEYNDGARDRRSGYAMSQLSETFEFSAPSEHERMQAMRTFRKWCRENGVTIPLPLRTETETTTT